MKFRTLPETDVRVSEIGFGLWTISTGWWGTFTEGEAIALMHKALDLGITLFDAADTYGNGYSEELIAKAFPKQRDQIVIATKVGYNFYDHGDERKGQREIPQDFSVDFIRTAVDKALARLKTDRIDILQLHNIRMPQVEDDALWTLMEKLVQEGKIRSYGAALGPAIGWLYEGIDCVQQRRPHILQHIYNMLEPHPGRQIMDEGEAAVTHDSPGAHALPHPRHPFQRHARGQVHGRDHLPADRSPQPPPELVAAQRPQENRDAASSSSAPTARSARPRCSGCWPIRASPRCLPNIYDEAQMKEFAAAPDCPPLTAEDTRARRGTRRDELRRRRRDAEL